MSQQIPKISFLQIPSCSDLPDTPAVSLKMINTINNLSSIQSHQPLQQDEDSLAERISPVNTTPHSHRKKKGGCTCKKTHCLKMYCECFAAGKKCGEQCGCVGCKNTVENEDGISKAKLNLKESGIKSASLAEKRCNCKKTKCLKRYCQCYNSGVACSEACRCQGCHNQPRQRGAPKEEEQEGRQVVSLPLMESFVADRNVDVSPPSPRLGIQRSVDDFSKFMN